MLTGSTEAWCLSILIVGYSHVTVNEGVGGEKCCTTRVHMKRNTYERKTMQNISYHSMESPKRSVC